MLVYRSVTYKPSGASACQAARKSLAILSRLVDTPTKEPNTQQVASQKKQQVASRKLPQRTPTFIYITFHSPSHEQKMGTHFLRSPKRHQLSPFLPFPQKERFRKLVAWSSKAAHFSRLTTHDHRFEGMNMAPLYTKTTRLNHDDWENMLTTCHVAEPIVLGMIRSPSIYL